MICRKATVALPDANFLSSRAQNRGFCARGWSSGKRPRDYGSRFFVISVPNGVHSVPNGVHSVPNGVHSVPNGLQSVLLLVFALLLKHPF